MIDNYGIGADCAACFARSGIPKQFCDLYQFPKMKSFRYSLYGVVAANELCREWQRVGQYWFEVWASEGCRGDFVFEVSELVAYDEKHDKFLAWCQTLDVRHPAWDRTMEVRNWRPSKPVLQDA